MLFEHLERLFLALYFRDNYYISHVYLQLSSGRVEDFSSGRLKIDIGPAILHVPVIYLAVAVSQYVTVMQCTVYQNN